MRHRKRIKRAENDKVSGEFHPSDGNRVIRPPCGTSTASSGCNQRDRLTTELHSLCKWDWRWNISVVIISLLFFQKKKLFWFSRKLTCPSSLRIVCHQLIHHRHWPFFFVFVQKKMFGIFFSVYSRADPTIDEMIHRPVPDRPNAPFGENGNPRAKVAPKHCYQPFAICRSWLNLWIMIYDGK